VPPPNETAGPAWGERKCGCRAPSTFLLLLEPYQCAMRSMKRPSQASAAPGRVFPPTRPRWDGQPATGPLDALTFRREQGANVILALYGAGDGFSCWRGGAGGARVGPVVAGLTPGRNQQHGPPLRRKLRVGKPPTTPRSCACLPGRVGFRSFGPAAWYAPGHRTLQTIAAWTRTWPVVVWGEIVGGRPRLVGTQRGKRKAGGEPWPQGGFLVNWAGPAGC